MFENPKRGRQARHFTTNVPKILVLKWSSEPIFPKNSRWVPLKALWRKWHFPLMSMHLKCKDWRRYKRKRRLKTARMAKLWLFWEGHTQPALSEKVQRGDQEKFFKNRPNSSPCFNGPTALWRKRHYPVNCIHL